MLVLLAMLGCMQIGELFKKMVRRRELDGLIMQQRQQAERFSEILDFYVECCFVVKF